MNPRNILFVATALSVCTVPALAQQAIHTPAAAHTSTGVLMVRELAQFTRYSSDPTGLDREVDDLVFITDLAYGVSHDTVIMLRVPVFFRDIDSDVAGEVIDALNASGRYDVRTAANGFEAGMLARQSRPHVVLLDVTHSQAEAMNVCRNIKSNEYLQSARVIASADSHAGDIDCLLRDGFDGHIRKPYTAAELAEAIEKATNILE